MDKVNLQLTFHHTAMKLSYVNIMKTGKNADYQHFALFLQCVFPPRTWKVMIMLKGYHFIFLEKFCTLPSLKKSAFKGIVKKGDNIENN